LIITATLALVAAYVENSPMTYFVKIFVKE